MKPYLSLKELEGQLISLSAQSGRQALFGNTEALDELKGEFHEY